MNILRALIVSDDAKLAGELDLAVTEAQSGLHLRVARYQLEDSEFEGLVHQYAPDLVFLDLADSPNALRLSSLIRRHNSAVQLIGIAADATRDTLLAAIRGGMCDVIAGPLAATDVQRALLRAQKTVKEAAPTISLGQIMSFLPAKVGSGSSTVAVHTAATMSRFGKGRVALLDFDFDCGVIDFMLKLPQGHGITDVVEYGIGLDESIWSRVVTKLGKLDVVRSGAGQSRRRVTGKEAECVLGYARRRYDVTCVDLPGAMDDSAISVFEQSNQIFIICTPDLSSVHLARRRLNLLRQMNLGERVRIIYNRSTAKSLMTRSAVEDALGAPVYAVIENDYEALQSALMNGRPLDIQTALGRSYTRLSHRILGIQSETASTPSSMWATLIGKIWPATLNAPARKSGVRMIAPPAQQEKSGTVIVDASGG